jgi:hypothetical protein
MAWTACRPPNDEFYLVVNDFSPLSVNDMAPLSVDDLRWEIEAGTVGTWTRVSGAT